MFVTYRELPSPDWIYDEADDCRRLPAIAFSLVVAVAGRSPEPVALAVAAAAIVAAAADRPRRPGTTEGFRRSGR